MYVPGDCNIFINMFVIYNAIEKKKKKESKFYYFWPTRTGNIRTVY